MATETGTQIVLEPRVTLAMPIAAALEITTAALKAEGFGVLTKIDVQATMKEKLGEEFEPYLILGACNPQLAHAAISTDPEIGLLLPCNVVLHEARWDRPRCRLSIQAPCWRPVAGRPAGNGREAKPAERLQPSRSKYWFGIGITVGATLLGWRRPESTVPDQQRSSPGFADRSPG